MPKQTESLQSGNEITGAHGGNWNYCDSCAEKLAKCTMCGKNLVC